MRVSGANRLLGYPDDLGVCGSVNEAIARTLEAARYVEMLRALPAGLSEWAVHPGLDGPDLRAQEPDDWRRRYTDYEFLVSAEALEAVEREGIVLLSYEPLRELWAADGRTA